MHTAINRGLIILASDAGAVAAVGMLGVGVTKGAAGDEEQPVEVVELERGLVERTSPRTGRCGRIRNSAPTKEAVRI